MKALGSLVWILIVGAILAVVYFAGGFNALFGVVPSGNYIIEPQYGTYSCLPAGQHENEFVPAVFHPSGPWENSYYDAYMVCPGNTPQCKFGYTLECNAVFGCTYTGGYEFRNEYGVSKGWTTAPTTVLGNGEKRTIWVSGIALTGEAFDFKIYTTEAHPAYAAESYQRYHLVQESSTGYTDVANPGGCERPVIKSIEGDNIIPELCLSGCVQNVEGNRVLWNQYWNYLGGYNLAPAEQLHTDPTDGQPVYCLPTGSYAVLRTMRTVTTESTTYYIPATFKRNEECCPGMTLGTSTCNDYFKWVEGPVSCEVAECDMYGTISSCPGAGSWVVDFSDPRRQTLYRALSCDASNCCEMQTIQVECTSSSQCSPSKPICKNYVCVVSGIDPFLPDCGNDICEDGENDENSDYYCPADCETTPKCGDGTCDQGESPANCPGDCPTTATDDWAAIWMIIMPVLFAAVGYYKKEWIGAVIGGVGGLIIGIMIFTITSMAWWQQLLLAAGLIGGLAIFGYLLILAIPMIIAALLVFK